MDHIDAVNPANIGAGYNGQPVARGTVLADPAGQWFDVSDTGNASPAAVAKAVAVRHAKGFWSLLYVNQSGERPMTDALVGEGLGWAPASAWPSASVFMWAADPSGNIAAGRWRPVVVPLLVQYHYAGGFDLSRVAGTYPGRVAGYIDGPQSRWPDNAWGRFAPIPDRPVEAGAQPSESTRGKADRMVIIKQANGAAWWVTGDHAIGIEDGPDQESLVASGVGVAIVSDEFAAKVRANLQTVN